MTQDPKQDNTLMVSGASGKLGRAVLRHLLEAGVRRIVAGTRTPEKLEAFAERGVELRRVDFDDPDSLSTAFAGVDRLLIISTDAVAVAGARVRQHRAAIAGAAQAGVGHVLYTSLTRAAPDSPVYLAADHAATERALADSGLAYTALRHNLYADMLPYHAASMLKEGRAFAAVGSGGIAYVTREDCARVAAAVLTSAVPPRGPVEVGGSEAISREQLAQLVGEIAGSEIRFETASEAALLEAFVASGLSHERAAVKAAFEVAIAQGYLGHVSGAVHELTGQPPTQVRTVLQAAHASGGAA